MKQAYLLTILGMLGLAPVALAQDVHPEAPSGSEEEQAQQEAGAATSTAAAEEEDRGPKRIWRGSSIFFDQSVSGWTITHEGLRYNPTTSTLIRFTPRVYLDDHTSIRLRQDLSIEETASDSNTYNGQPIFGDGLFDLMRTDIVKVGDFSFSAGGRLTVPWSIQSQANRTFFGLGAIVDGTYTWPHVLEGFSISLTAFANYYFSDRNVASTQSNYPCLRAGPVGGDPSAIQGSCDQAGSSTTSMFSVLFGPIFSLTPVKHFNLSAIVFSWASLGRSTDTASVPIASGAVTVGDTSRTHWRNEEVLYLSASYSFTQWFDLSLNYYAFTGLLTPDGNWRNPFWGPDQQVSLTAFFTLDQLYNAVTGETHDPARVQRTRTAARAAGGML